MTRLEVAILSVAFLVFFIVRGNWDSDYGFVAESDREVARNEVRQLFQELKPGMSAKQVQELIATSDHLHAPNFDDEIWWAGTRPCTFLATEWVVVFKFDGDKLQEATVGTYDNATISPPGAPRLITFQAPHNE